jgi:hypothetical protein
MHRTIFVAAVAAIVFGTTSAALPAPILSGSYIITSRHHCQEVLVVDINKSGLVDSVNLGPGSNGDTQLLLTATFTPKKGKLAFTGFVDDGSNFLLQLTGSQQATQGEVLSEQPNNGSTTYSNTATTLTIGSSVYNAMYGQVDDNGIAHAIAFMRFYTDKGNAPCSEQAEGFLQ